MARYRVSANLVWDVEGTGYELAEQKAMEQLIHMAQAAGVRLRKPKVGLNKLKDRSGPNITLAEYSPDEIFKIISLDGHRREFKIGDVVHMVRMNSQRYFIFQENKKCVACGIEGNKMLLELPYGSKYPHFNLYANENGQQVLMTKDHKIPVARGGKDVMENFATCCAPCNNIKADFDLTYEEVGELRKLYNKNNDVQDIELLAKRQEMIDNKKIRVA